MCGFSTVAFDVRGDPGMGPPLKLAGGCPHLFSQQCPGLIIDYWTHLSRNSLPLVSLESLFKLSVSLFVFQSSLCLFILCLLHIVSCIQATALYLSFSVKTCPEICSKRTANSVSLGRPLWVNRIIREPLCPSSSSFLLLLSSFFFFLFPGSCTCLVRGLKLISNISRSFLSFL